MNMPNPKLDADLLRVKSLLADRLDAVFGAIDDPVEEVADRARRLLGDLNVIVWEGDAQTFQFMYVSPLAETLLGYPAARWSEPGFWASTVVHPDDSPAAIAYCALATGQGRDHNFQYRALAADGRVILLHDVVRVIKGARGIASRLRGLMVEISA